MSWSRVQGNSGFTTALGTSTTLALGSPTPAGNLVVVSVLLDGTGVGSATIGVTDSAGNAYAQSVHNGTNTTLGIAIWSSVVTVSGTLTITVTSTASCLFAIDVSEYNGGTAADGISANGTTAGPTTLTAGTITPTGTDLIVCAGSVHAVYTMTTGGSFLTSSNLAGTGAHAGLTVEYLLAQTSSLNPSMTASVTGAWGCVSAAWAASGASIIVPYWHLFQGANYGLADTP